MSETRGFKNSNPGEPSGAPHSESSTLRRLANKNAVPQRPKMRRPAPAKETPVAHVEPLPDSSSESGDSSEFNDAILLAAVEGETKPKYSAPNVIDFSPLGIGSGERKVLADVWGRSAGHVLHPSVALEDDIPLSEQATDIIRGLSDVSADAWREHTLLALPIDSGFAAALVAAVYRVHGIWPTVITFYRPDPKNEPALWELAHVENLNL